MKARREACSGLILVVLTLGLPLKANAAAAPGRSALLVPTASNIVYAAPGGVSLTLDVYEPSGAGPFPALMLIHGGAFRSGTKEDWASVAGKAVRSGFVAVAINYRMACDPASPPAGVDPSLCGYHATTPVDDTLAAIGWVRANGSAYKADPGRVGALGGSAGGNLALMAGVVGAGAERPDAMASWSGDAEFQVKPNAAKTQYVGCSLSACPDLWAAASPYTFVAAGDPPTYLSNSQYEKPVPLQEATDMADALTAAGVPNQLQVLPGSQHVGEPPKGTYVSQVWSATAAFLHTYLG